MIIFAVGSASSLGKEVLNLLSDNNYKIIATYHNKKPKSLKRGIKLEKFDLNSTSQLQEIIRKNNLFNKKVVLLNFSVVKNDNAAHIIIICIFFKKSKCIEV